MTTSKPKRLTWLTEGKEYSQLDIDWDKKISDSIYHNECSHAFMKQMPMPTDCNIAHQNGDYVTQLIKLLKDHDLI